MTKNNPTPIFDIYMAHFATSIATIAITEFNLFSVISNNPATVSELARKLGIADRPAEAMLNACVALDLLKKKDDRYFITPLSDEFLVKGKPSYIGDIFELNRGDTYRKLRDAILKNSQQIYGEEDTWEKHRADEKKVAFFTRAMNGLSVVPGSALADAFDFSPYHTLLDIGGGSGAISIAAASKHPHLKAIIFDIPPVCHVAEEFIVKNNLKDRVTAKHGNMFEDPFPDGADVVILSNILHDWNDERCNKLIEKSYQYLPDGGSIIIHEALLKDNKSGPLFPSLMSLAMLLWTEGRQFTGDEISKMLKGNGFKEIEIKPTACYYNIVTGTKT